MGGKRLYKLGAANAETYSTETDFEEWKKDLWPTLVKYFESIQDPAEAAAKPRKTSMVVDDGSLPLIAQVIEAGDTAEYKEKNASVQVELTSKQYAQGFDVPISKVIQLRQNLDEGNTLEFTYDLQKTGLTYKTATNLAIFPQNAEQDVLEVADLVKANLKDTFAFVPNPEKQSRGNIKHPFKTPCTVREALECYVDLHGFVQKKTIKTLANFCTVPAEKDKLLAIANNKTDYEQLGKNNIGLLDLLRQYRSIRMNLGELLQASQRIMPRYYTIASSSLKYPNEIKIAISMAWWKTQAGDKKYGLTSAYLLGCRSSLTRRCLFRVGCL